MIDLEHQDHSRHCTYLDSRNKSCQPRKFEILDYCSEIESFKIELISEREKRVRKRYPFYVKRKNQVNDSEYISEDRIIQDLA